MSQTAKIFTHGRSQAVRLPKEFRFSGKEVRVTKIGDRVILEPIEAVRKVDWAALDAISDELFFPNGREQPEMPPDQVIFDD